MHPLLARSKTRLSRFRLTHVGKWNVKFFKLFKLEIIHSWSWNPEHQTITVKCFPRSLWFWGSQIFFWLLPSYFRHTWNWCVHLLLGHHVPCKFYFGKLKNSQYNLQGDRIQSAAQLNMILESWTENFWNKYKHL